MNMNDEYGGDSMDFSLPLSKYNLAMFGDLHPQPALDRIQGYVHSH